MSPDVPDVYPRPTGQRAEEGHSRDLSSCPAAVHSRLEDSSTVSDDGRRVEEGSGTFALCRLRQDSPP